MAIHEKQRFEETDTEMRIVGYDAEFCARWAQQQKLSDYSATERPWLWWYWLGSAVDKGV